MTKVLEKMSKYLEQSEEELNRDELYHAKLPLNSLISTYMIYESALEDSPEFYEAYSMYKRGVELLVEINHRLHNHHGVSVCKRLLQY